MRKLINLLFLVSLMATFVLTAAAWDDTGHKLTAYVAWQQMTPETREKVFDILLKAPEDSHLNVFYNAFEPRSEQIKRLELFMIAATWPDIVRNRDFPTRYEKYNHSNWHYADIFWKQTADGKAEILENFPEESGKAIPKLADFEKILGDPEASVGEKAVALAWFLHVGGDIHNPLHNASRVTDLEPKGDQGGNMFVLREKTETQSRVNLHGYWDGIIRENNTRKNDACDADYLVPIANKIIRKHPFSKMRERLKPDDFKAWNMEGFNLLNEVVYQGITRGEMPSKNYNKRALRVGEEQIALAGYRLAATLNRIFGGKAE